MYQEQVPQPRDERSWNNPSDYQEGYGGTLQESDQLADAIARRLQARTPINTPPAQTPLGGARFGSVSRGPSSAQRLALGIVSLALLVPLAGTTLGILGPFAGLIGLGMICVVVLGINIVFNMQH